MARKNEMPDIGWQFKSKEHGGWLDTRYENLLDLMHNGYEIRQVAAPAEDVRAVEEELVYLFTDEQGMPGWTDRWDVAKHLPYAVEKAYRHPQRPFVLPERIIGQQHGDKIAEAEQRGWNSCLDEVAKGEQS